MTSDLTITPSSGYNISNVVVDGVSQGAVTSYTFSNVTANHTISATFYASTASITATKVQPVPTSQTNYLIDASVEAQTTVTVSTTASVNITVERYSSNPHPVAALPVNMLPRYSDIKVSNLMLLSGRYMLSRPIPMPK